MVEQTILFSVLKKNLVKIPCLSKKQSHIFFHRHLSIRQQWCCFIVLLLFICFMNILPKQLFVFPYSTAVYDRKGELLGARVAQDGQWRFPPATEINPKFQKCIVEYEDRYFYYHNGVNPVALVKALYRNVRMGRVVSGGSTISMQTIRLSRRGKRTYKEKFIETIMALRLELRFSKQEIMAMYASFAPFGGNIVGLEAASWRYFNHSAQDLSWAEAATLAVLPNSPSSIFPGRNREALQRKRDMVLHRLMVNGEISQETYELSCSEPLPEGCFELPNTACSVVNHYFKVKTGQRVQTTIHFDKQQQVEKIVEHWSKVFSEQNIKNMALLVVDSKDNSVVCYCGNAIGTQSLGNMVDIVRSRRSTGSILKPFLYCAALQEGEILPKTLLGDIPININGFSPHNFDYNNYDGAVYADEALYRSLNVPSVMLLRQYSVPKFYNFLKKIGISTLDRPSDDYGLSLILGGAEATLWDIVQAYTKLSNVLQQNTPKDLKLEVTENQATYKNLYNEAAAWFTISALTELNRPDEINRQMLASVGKVAWKTGTSYGYRDAWAVGMNKRYVVGVWVGNATGESNVNLIGAKAAAPVLFDVLNLFSTQGWFDFPDRSMVEERICQESGHLSGRFCPNTTLQAIPEAGLKTTPCPYHKYVATATQNTADYAGVGETTFVLPPAWAYYYKKKHPEYEYSEKSSTIQHNMPMQFIYPTNAITRISIPNKNEDTEKNIVLDLVHEDNNATVFWHIDNEYITATTDIHKLNYTFEKGTHSVTAIDDKNNQLTVKIIIE